MSYTIAIRALIVVALSVAAIVMTGCGGGSATAVSPAKCTYIIPAEPSVQLIYPAPGATGIATSIGVVVYASSTSAPIVLETGALTISAPATAVPSPLPSPAATPRSGSQYYAVSVGTLAAEATYTVANTIDEPSCAANGSTIITPTQNADGTFTTVP